MDWNRDIDTEEGLLKSLIALLFSLALAAERAAGRRYAVRCLVLWALRRSEPIARLYVYGDDAETAHAASALATCLFRNSRADALELAALFRAAAHALKPALREVQRITRWFARHEARIEQDRALFTSPFERGGRTKGPAVCDYSPSPRLSEHRQRKDHLILARARIPAWPAINWPDTS